MLFFWILLSIVSLQRIIELYIARKNEKILKSKGAVEYDNGGYKVIVLMHILFFFSLITEKLVGQTPLNPYWYIFFILFVLAQFLRYWSISTLGIHWNTKILVIPGNSLIKRGPYKFIRHPNYTAVITEIAVIPLAFSCYITALVFSILNVILLKRRVKLEEDALNMRV